MSVLGKGKEEKAARVDLIQASPRGKAAAVKAAVWTQWGRVGGANWVRTELPRG